MRREWMMNLPGALVVTIWEVIFILSINNSIQNELLAKTHDLSKINDSLNSIIKTREKLISILSHDFRGPVISIKAGLEMLYEDELDTNEEINPRKKKIYTELIKKTKSTIKLMDDLLLWSRSQTSQINCETEINSLEEIEEILIDYCGLHSGVKNIIFNIDIPKKGNVLGDKKLLNGILLNLISNAVKFSNTNGHIDVLAKHNENQWTFTIADNGIGIEKEVLERIQNGQYYTSNGTDNERGHGLGLQLVREFLDKHDSNLEITSEVGKGTTMSFNLNAA
jgi:signal transduction histidine kinase